MCFNFASRSGAFANHFCQKMVDPFRNRAARFRQHSFIIARSEHCTGFNRKSASYDVITKTGSVSPMRNMPKHVPKPEYATSGVVTRVPEFLEKKTPEQISKMRDSCRLARSILHEVSKHVKVGITTDELDEIAHLLSISRMAYPSPLNYRGFPKSICTSVNNVACHGIPDDRPLCNGDIVSVDVTVFFNGYHGDCAATYAVGDVDRGGQNLISVAEECLRRGIEACGPGRNFKEIGKAIGLAAADAGCSVVPAFCGHGIGTYFHGPPDIYHFDNDAEGEMFEGLMFTVEPVVSEGGPDVVILEDGWTAVTLDNSRAAQFEHTVCITAHGVEVLTLL